MRPTGTIKLLSLAIALSLPGALQCTAPIVGTLPGGDAGAESEGGKRDAAIPDVGLGGEGASPLDASAETMPGDGSESDANGEAGSMTDSAIPEDAAGDAGDSNPGDTGATEGGVTTMCPPGHHLCTCASGNDYCLKNGFVCVNPSSC